MAADPFAGVFEDPPGLGALPQFDQQAFTSRLLPLLRSHGLTGQPMRDCASAVAAMANAEVHQFTAALHQALACPQTSVVVRRPQARPARPERARLPLVALEETEPPAELERINKPEERHDGRLEAIQAELAEAKRELSVLRAAEASPAAMVGKFDQLLGRLTVQEGRVEEVERENRRLEEQRGELQAKLHSCKQFIIRQQQLE